MNLRQLRGIQVFLRQHAFVEDAVVDELVKEFGEGELLGLGWAAVACGGAPKAEAVGGEG